MLLSTSHQFIFIHIGKTAGMSLRTALQPFCTEPEKFKIRRPPAMKDGKPNPMHVVWETLLLHPTCAQVKRELPAGLYDGCFKFAFVRNPWDLLVSLYHFMLRDADIPRHDEVSALSGFPAFIDWSIAEAAPFPKGITKCQADMVTDAEGRLLLDFVGHYETLHQDFAKVCRKVGIEAELPHLNVSRHRDYRSYYDEPMRNKVAEHFRRDIDLFGYSFDGLAGSTP
jgi:hypothetical protein